MAVGKPSTSATARRLRPLVFLPPSQPDGPPLSAVFTDRLSITPAVGSGFLPAPFLATPGDDSASASARSSRQPRNRRRSVERSWNPDGSARRWRPVTEMHCAASAASRGSALRGCPVRPCTGGGRRPKACRFLFTAAPAPECACSIDDAISMTATFGPGSYAQHQHAGIEGRREGDGICRPRASCRPSGGGRPGNRTATQGQGSLPDGFRRGPAAFDDPGGQPQPLADGLLHAVNRPPQEARTVGVMPQPGRRP